MTVTYGQDWDAVFMCVPIVILVIKIFAGPTRSQNLFGDPTTLDNGREIVLSESVRNLHRNRLSFQA